MEVDYLDQDADIKELSVTTIYPANKEEKSVFDATSIKIKGTKGKARYQVAYDAKSDLGDYKYIFQLVDSKNKLSEKKSVIVTLQIQGDPQLAIYNISKKTGQPGDHIKLSGTGFDNSSLLANSVGIAGIAAEIIDSTSNTIMFKVPDNAFSGPITVSNKYGVTSSKFDFLIKPSIKIYNDGQRTLAPQQMTRFNATLSGIENQTIEWRVNRIPGGSPEFGTIDKDCLYTAPAILPDSGVVEISAISLANKSLIANVRIAIAEALSLKGSGIISARTGGRIQDNNGLLVLNIPAKALKEDLNIKALNAEFIYSSEGLPGIPNNTLPIAKIFIETSNPSALKQEVTFQLLLPIWASYKMKHKIMIRKRGENNYAESNLPSKFKINENGDYLSGNLKLFSNECEYVITRYIDPAVPVPLFPLEVTKISTPVNIEEGLTLPVLIEGKNFWPGYTRVVAADPGIAQYLQFGTVLISKDQKQLGFTLRIHPIPTLGRNAKLPVSFRVERLRSNGSISETVVTNPNDFIINGLPEIIVSQNASSNIFTVDGQHIDEVKNYDDSGRYSTVVVEEGSVLGIGSVVSNVGVWQESLNLESVNAFENVFGSLRWVTDIQRNGNSVKFFQPENRLVRFDVTGPVRINGNLYFAGMHGGENPRRYAFNVYGDGKIGGLANNTLSGGIGGDGGVTQESQTQEGQDAGNRTDFGKGRGAYGLVDTSQILAGGGARFDPIVTDYADLILNPVAAIGNLISGDVFSVLQKVGKLIFGSDAEAPYLSATGATYDGHIVAGRGGAGGHRPSGVGGGAAGALRITSGTEFIIGESGLIDGIGGRGGFGEPHRFLGSPGGGGGGGAGGVVKFQAPLLFNHGKIDLSGGDCSGAIFAQNRVIMPDRYRSLARIQVLNGKQQGGCIYYANQLNWNSLMVGSPEITVVWPNGRTYGDVSLPVTDISGIGVAEGPWLRELLGFYVITSDRRVRTFNSRPDYYSGNILTTNPFFYALDIRLDIRERVFIPTDIAQSPIAPYHIFVSGYVPIPVPEGHVGMAISQIHEFDAGFHYVRNAFNKVTYQYYYSPGHLTDIDFLSSGQLLGLMCLARISHGG